MTLTAIGKIQKTFGSNGELLVSLYDHIALRPSVALFMYIDNLPVPFYIKQHQPKGNKEMIILQDYETEALASEFVGYLLYYEDKHVPRQAPQPSPLDWGRLVGLAVIDSQEGAIGTISHWFDYPGNPCLEITHPSGKDILIPANNDIIKDINLATQQLHVQLPEGLLSLYLEEE